MKYQLIGAPIALYKLFDTGAEKAPSAIRKALGINFQDLKLKGLTQEKANTKISRKAAEVFNKIRPFFIGGDHSITLPILEAQSKPFDVFWFDAHPDAYDEYGGSKISHATVLRRISELPKCKKIYLIGSRVQELEEKEFLKKCEKVKLIRPWQIKKIGSRRYYVTIDIDVLDPRDAPGVDHALPKGMRLPTLLDAVKHLRKGNIIGADLVEIVPDNDHTGLTEKNAVKIIKEFLK